MSSNFQNYDANGQTVLMRVDFNVPLDGDGIITDDTRIRASIPSIKKVLDQNGKLVLMSHLGRPKGQVVKSMSLFPVSERLSELTGAKVHFASDTIGKNAQEKYELLGEGEILLLENLRFSNDETDNNEEFSKSLSQFGSCYVNDAFGTAHRAHASTVGVVEYFSNKYAGLLMHKELKNLGQLVADPQPPFVAILGGAKVKGKVDIILNLLDKVDVLLLGGGMIYTFYKAQGFDIGDSLVDQDSIDVAKDILQKSATSKAKLVLPEDIVIADSFSNDSNKQTTNSSEIPEGWMGLDIGPATLANYVDIISDAKSIFWNGPMGVFEMESFKVGTEGVCKAIVTATKMGAHSVVGGGDSVAAVNKAGLSEGITHISTGGGASLEFMAGNVLPGVKALVAK
ncbi:MAG: phosphoglycerate kinase [bacterium]|nr:phosphoglycerate kinase [bacterium]MCP4799910.1 phosphoglycerate kinase [bacterium]